MLEGPITGTATTTNSVFSISNLPYGTYKITITDSTGSAVSQELTIGEECVTGRAIASSRSDYPEIELDWNGSMFQVGESYPNPFPQSTNIPIVLSRSGEFHIQVFTATGQAVYQQKQSVEAGPHLITLDKETVSYTHLTLPTTPYV